MLEVSNTGFKTTVVTVPKDIKKNMLTTYEKIRNLSREFETIKNKNSRTEKHNIYLKISTEWDQHRMNMIDERINELKDKPAEIIQVKKQKEKILKN